VISVVIFAPIGTFFTALASEAAKDAYPPIKRWASAVFAARRGRGHVVLLDDEHNRQAAKHGAAPFDPATRAPRQGARDEPDVEAVRRLIDPTRGRGPRWR